MSVDVERIRAMAADPSYAHITFRLDVPMAHIEDPERFEGARVTLPSGLTATFGRMNRWEQLDFTSGTVERIPEPSAN